MAKKIGGLDSFFSNESVEITAKNSESSAVETTSSRKEKPKKGGKESEIRATFIVRESRLEQLKAIAYWDRAKIKDVHDAALAAYIESRQADIPKVLVNRAEKRR